MSFPVPTTRRPRDVCHLSVYVPQSRHQVAAPITPTVRVGNGNSAVESFTVTTVITRSSDGAQVSSATQAEEWKVSCAISGQGPLAL